MAKKKIKKTKKAKKAKPVKKIKRFKKLKKIVKPIKKAKKVIRKKKKIKAALPAVPKVEGGKLVGRVEHFFDKISVAAIAVKVPFKVGDTLRIKGHTTDFTQPVESLQIEHLTVDKVKKGDDVGIKVKEFCRAHDLVFLVPPEKAVKAEPKKTAGIQEPMFPGAVPQKAMSVKKAGGKTVIQETPIKTTTASKSNQTGLTETKFLKF